MICIPCRPEQDSGTTGKVQLKYVVSDPSVDPVSQRAVRLYWGNKDHKGPHVFILSCLCNALKQIEFHCHDAG